MNVRRNVIIITLLVFAFCLIVPEAAFAASTSTPFDSTIDKIIGFLTGSFAKVLSIGGLVLTIGSMMFTAGELSMFGRSLIFLLLGITIISFSSEIIDNFVGSGTGAVFF